MTHSHSHTRPGHGPARADDTGLAELLDLDAALAGSLFSEVPNAASEALRDAPSIAVDLGAGTGTGTLALANRFLGTRIHSIDASPELLERLSAAATNAGIGDRVEPHLVDLDGDWPAVLPDSVDLAWAALSPHHVTDPARVLRQALGVLRPGGVFVAIELAGAARYYPEDLATGRAGLGDRIVSALARQGYPVTAEWTAALNSAGFIRVERFEIPFTASARTTEGARYLALQLARNRTHLSDELAADDLAALDAVIAALEVDDSELEQSQSRAIWIAVTPEHQGLSASDAKGPGR
jgi:SAM-dependent methyltransferase